MNTNKIQFIKSLLDNDLYKFSMSYAYMKLYPDAEGTFTFTDRNNHLLSTKDDDFVTNVVDGINALADLTLTDDEFEWCVKTMPYIPQCYWEWLRGFHFEPSKVKITAAAGQPLSIQVTDKLYKATFYEVPILAIVSESWHKSQIHIAYTHLVRKVINDKISFSNDNTLPFSEFGTRRRFSFDVQDIIVEEIAKNAMFCAGTSNVYLAYKYGLKPIGTVAHEWIMFHGSLFGYRMANYEAYEAWVKVYDGNLGIALTDTYGTKLFFKNFTMKQAKLFDGIRQDSGDEKQFVDNAVERYKELGIDPMSKTIIFSNALDFKKYKEIANYCSGKVKFSAGIGTNLTCDCGYPSMNIVMKLTQCRMNAKQNMTPCIKISDDKGKVMGDEFEIKKCLHDIETC